MILKNLFIFLSLMMMFVLTACGGNKYDDAINEVIDLDKKSAKESGADTSIYTRENALIRVYDGGSIYKLHFIFQKIILVNFHHMITLKNKVINMKKWIACLETERMIDWVCQRKHQTMKKQKVRRQS